MLNSFLATPSIAAVADEKDWYGHSQASWLACFDIKDTCSMLKRNIEKYGKSPKGFTFRGVANRQRAEPIPPHCQREGQTYICRSSRSREQERWRTEAAHYRRAELATIQGRYAAAATLPRYFDYTNFNLPLQLARPCWTEREIWDGQGGNMVRAENARTLIA